MAITINGFCGISKNPCNIFVAEDKKNELLWYAVAGSPKAYAIHLEDEDLLSDGVWVDELEDTQILSVKSPIETKEDLIDWVFNNRSKGMEEVLQSIENGQRVQALFFIQESGVESPPIDLDEILEELDKEEIIRLVRVALRCGYLKVGKVQDRYKTF